MDKSKIDASYRPVACTYKSLSVFSLATPVTTY